MSRIVSFDLEGTLVDMNFSEKVWNEGIPLLYAQKTGLKFEDAKRIVLNEYMKIGEERIEWYDVTYWFNRFGLSNVEDLFNKYKDEVHIYPEVKNVLNLLSKKFTLILTSNSAKEFIKFLTREIKGYFKHTFSATSDFKTTKKNVEFYKRICEILNVNPWEIIHVGDRLIEDFEIPKKIGIKAYLLDRLGKTSNLNKNFVVKDLNEFVNEILKDEKG
ncbi:MAG: HAD family hydrolase [Candidatus Bathyarchaeota archaeon]|nr:HAD family hydrolase [Candidatus Bathyarchaeota archaeon]